MKCTRLIINICLEICKKHFLPKKSPRKHKINRVKTAMMRKRSKLQKKIQRATNHQTKENVLNRIDEIENNLKISIIQKEIKEKQVLLLLSSKNHNNSTNAYKNNSTFRAGIGHVQDEQGITLNQATKNWANYWMNDTIEPSAPPTQQRLLSIQKTSLDTHMQIHCQTLVLLEKTS